MAKNASSPPSLLIALTCWIAFVAGTHAELLTGNLPQTKSPTTTTVFKGFGVNPTKVVNSIATPGDIPDGGTLRAPVGMDPSANRADSFNGFGFNPGTGFYRCNQRTPTPREVGESAAKLRQWAAANPQQGVSVDTAGTLIVNSVTGGHRRQLQTITATISVYFHIVKDSSGGGNIPDSHINSQMKVLSNAYSGVFAFTRAATYRYTDPNDAFQSLQPGSGTSSAEYTLKAQTRRGNYRDLNIWFTSLGNGLLGWATFPSSYYTDSYTQLMDGIVAKTGTQPGGNVGAYNQGDTVTHEVGHWLNLYHTFQGGCTTTGDSVSDTPAEANPQFNCVARDSCPSMNGTDPIKNFMDYTDDACMNTFTTGQRARMRGMWTQYRAGK